LLLAEITAGKWRMGKGKIIRINAFPDHDGRAWENFQLLVDFMRSAR
jgi:hypothetical protein